MLVVVTHITLRSRWLLIPFFRHNVRIFRQLDRTSGVLDRTAYGPNLRDFYTATGWTDDASMIAFAQSGAHLEAMKEIQKFSDHFSTRRADLEKFPTASSLPRFFDE